MYFTKQHFTSSISLCLLNKSASSKYTLHLVLTGAVNSVSKAHFFAASKDTFSR